VFKFVLFGIILLVASVTCDDLLLNDHTDNETAEVHNAHSGNTESKNISSEGNENVE
jgi:hypothetical protein